LEHAGHPDTDIRGLVAIESRTQHRFEFHVENGSDAPISASTALAYAEAGGEIAHALSVYEARPRDPLHLPAILKLLRHPGYRDARNAIDLSYAEDSLAEEKMSFLSALAERLSGSAYFPYEETAGLLEFRQRLGSFFRNYFRLHWDERHFVATPSAADAVRSLLTLFRPRRALVDSNLARVLGPVPTSVEVLEIPRSADLASDLIERLKPELAYYTMPEVETRTRDSFLRIVEVAAKARTRVLIDISEAFELSSTPTSNSVFRYLAQNPLPPHVSLVCGLVKNRLYPELQLCFLVSENADLLQALTHAAELTHSRVPVVSQLYYDRILQDLLSFQLSAASRGRDGGIPRGTMAEDGFFRKSFIQPSPDSDAAFRHPAIVGEATARVTADAIRLDYGENCLPAPESMKRALFEAFAKMRILPEEQDPAPELLQLARDRFGLSEGDGSQPLKVELGGGVAPLFAAMAAHCARTKRTLVFPEGAYGYFMASARFHGATTLTASTRAAERFKLAPDSLDAALKSAGTQAWVILSAPVVNPTGAKYTPAELRALQAIAAKHDALLVLDSVFSGLEFQPASAPGTDRVLLEPGRLALLGGISKEFAAGGLRVGFGVSSDPEILQAWRLSGIARPHGTLRFATKRIYGQLLRRDPELLAALDQQRQTLDERRTHLSRVLSDHGWTVLDPEGGLFLTASPTGLIGRSLADGTLLSLENLAHVLRAHTSLMINTPGWTGIPGHFRFVLSVEASELERALRAIREFHSQVKA